MAYKTIGPLAAPQVPDLVKLLKAPSPTVRHMTAEILGLIGSSEAVPELIHAAQDVDDLVRLSALGALRSIHPDPSLAIPVFIQGLADPGQSVTREIAALALGSYGSLASNAIPALSSAMTTNLAARQALSIIEPALGKE